MKEKFEEFNFGAEVRRRIELANQVLAEYRAAGYVLTVRQLYYQLVARGYIENSMRSYKRIVDTLTKARYAGMMDWDGIEDRTRDTMSPSAWDNHVSIMQAAESQFRLDRWHGQQNHVEIMIEKEALAGVFGPLVQELHVNVTANRGYSSASEMWRHAKRFQSLRAAGKTIHVLYFGDHDPSGLDMDRDVEERVGLLSRFAPFEFQRLALTGAQIDEYNPPPNPAKLTDSRANGYIADHGYESWELDALEPQVLNALVRDAVLPLRDEAQYRSVLAIEGDMRARFKGFIADEIDEWDEVFDGRWPYRPRRR